MSRMVAILWLVVAALFGASSAEARPFLHVAPNESQFASGRSGLYVAGFSPSWIVGAKLWIRADGGVTSGIGPVTATGTTPPTVTLSGTPSTVQTASGTPYVEIDCTTLGAITVSKFTFKVNGTVTATNVASAASGVVITGSGLTAGWAVGASAVNDVYTANVVSSAWADQSGAGNGTTQGTAAKQPTYVVPAAGPPFLSFVGATGAHVLVTAGVVANQTCEEVAFGRSTQNNPAGAAYMFDMGLDQGIIDQAGAGNALKQYWGTSLVNASTLTINADFVVDAFYSGASSTLTLNRTTVGPANPGSNTVSIGASVGNRGIGGDANEWGGRIYELLIVSGTLDPLHRARLAAYGSNRYGAILN